MDINSKKFRCCHGKGVCNECKIGIFGFPPNCEIQELLLPRNNNANISLTDLADYYQTDKGSRNNYTHIYEKYFNDYKQKPINLLEIGVARGASLKVWADYFNNSKIYGIDIFDECRTLCKDYPEITILIGNASDENFIKQSFTDTKFDIIIDDASHLVADIIKIFNNLWCHVNNGGIYIVEDLLPSRSDEYKIFYDFGRSATTSNEEWLQINSRQHLDSFILDLIMKLDTQNDIEFIHIYRGFMIVKKK